MLSSQQQIPAPNMCNNDEALKAMERETKEADLREEEEARRQADERARRWAERWGALEWARAEAEERKKKEEEEEQRKKAEEDRRQRELEEEEQRWRKAQAKEEEEATQKRKRDKGKGKVKEVKVMSLDNEDDDDDNDNDNDDTRRANQAFVEVPMTSRPTKRRRVGEKVKLGGKQPCQHCVEVGWVCEEHTSSTITKCLACTCQKLCCKAADESAPRSLGLTLHIGLLKEKRERESKGLQEVLNQLATLQAKLAIEREAQRQEHARLLDMVEHTAMGAFRAWDILWRLEDHLKFAGKIGPWEDYAREKERLEEEEERKDEEKKKKEEEEKVQERREEEDRGEGPSAPSS